MSFWKRCWPRKRLITTVLEVFLLMVVYVNVCYFSYFFQRGYITYFTSFWLLTNFCRESGSDLNFIDPKCMLQDNGGCNNNSWQDDNQTIPPTLTKLPGSNLLSINELQVRKPLPKPYFYILKLSHLNCFSHGMVCFKLWNKIVKIKKKCQFGFFRN